MFMMKTVGQGVPTVHSKQKEWLRISSRWWPAFGELGNEHAVWIWVKLRTKYWDVPRWLESALFGEVFKENFAHSVLAYREVDSKHAI